MEEEELEKEEDTRAEHPYAHDASPCKHLNLYEALVRLPEFEAYIVMGARATAMT